MLFLLRLGEGDTLVRRGLRLQQTSLLAAVAVAVVIVAVGVVVVVALLLVQSWLAILVAILTAGT